MVQKASTQRFVKSDEVGKKKRPHARTGEVFLTYGRRRRGFQQVAWPEGWEETRESGAGLLRARICDGRVQAE